MVHSEKKLYLVFEYLHQDLKKYMDSCSPTGLGASLIRVGFCNQKDKKHNFTRFSNTNKICYIITLKYEIEILHTKVMLHKIANKGLKDAFW